MSSSVSVLDGKQTVNNQKTNKLIIFISMGLTIHNTKNWLSN